MEASEKPQLPLDDEGAVRAIAGRLVIERLQVDDARAAKVVRERAETGQPPTQTVRDAIEIGARVLDRESAAVEVDYVRAEFERHAGELRNELAGTLEAGAETLAEQLATAFGADRNDSVQAQIREIVAGASQQQREALARVFAAEDGSNPLSAFQTRMAKALSESDERHRQEMAKVREGHSTAERAMRGEIAGLREHLARLLEKHEGDERVAEAEEVGTRKGLGFEGRVHEAIERIATARGDAAAHTGGEQAEGGGKKGDTLVELDAAEGPAAGRIVFEAKDKKLSKNQAWAELNEGMAARAAGYAVLVVAGEDRVPAGREQLHEYEGNKLIVAVDRDEPDGLALETAYRLAAARVRLASDGDLQVDAAAVRDAASEAVSILKQAQAIRSTLTGIKTSSDKARVNLDAMVHAVEAKLQRIESLIADADPDPE
jgi:hypothetical protein